MRIVLLGAPGVGKGTQASILGEKLKVPHIAVGDILRVAIAQQTPLGLKVKEIVAKGELVGCEVMSELVEQRLQGDDCKRGIVLEGFPRTLKQAEFLAGIITVDVVINITLAEQLIVARMGGRLIHPPSGRVYNKATNPPKQEGIDDVTGEALAARGDDNEDVIKARLRVYSAQADPIINYYRNLARADKLVYLEQSAEAPIGVVAEAIEASLRAATAASL